MSTSIGRETWADLLRRRFARLRFFAKRGIYPWARGGLGYIARREARLVAMAAIGCISPWVATAARDWRNGREERLRPVHPVVPDLNRRIRDLAKLTNNWDSYEGRPIDDTCIDLACSLVEPLLDLQLGTVQAVPCPDGGVQLEIHAGGIDLGLWISPANVEGEEYGS